MTKNSTLRRRSGTWMVVLPAVLLMFLMFWSQYLQIARNRERQRFTPLFQKTSALCETLLPSPVPLYFTGTHDEEWYAEGLDETGRKVCHADYETQTGRMTWFAFFNPNLHLTPYPTVSLAQARSRANYWYDVLNSALELPEKSNASITLVKQVAQRKIAFCFRDNNYNINIIINLCGGELDNLNFSRRPMNLNTSKSIKEMEQANAQMQREDAERRSNVYHNGVP